MQFKSVGTSDYSQAAKAVTGNMDSIYNTARETATDFTKIAKAAINAKRIQKEAVMKAEDVVNRQGMAEAGAAKERNILKDAIKDARNITRPAKRMAGVVAGLGAVSTAYVQKKEMDRDAADRAELKEYRNKLLAKNTQAGEDNEALRKQIEELQKKIASDAHSEADDLEAELNNTGDNSSKPDTDTEGNTSQITPPKTSVSTNLEVASSNTSSNTSFDLSKLTRKDYEDLAFAVSGEAGPGKDKFGVAASILNRVASDKFPNTVSSVINAPNQYEAVYKGLSKAQPQVADLFMSSEGQAQLQEAFKRLDGRTDFKGQSQLHNRSSKGNKDYDGDGRPDMDIMFDPQGNFFHYHWQ